MGCTSPRSLSRNDGVKARVRSGDADGLGSRTPRRSRGEFASVIDEFVFGYAQSTLTPLVSTCTNPGEVPIPPENTPSARICLSTLAQAGGPPGLVEAKSAAENRMCC